LPLLLLVAESSSLGSSLPSTTPSGAAVTKGYVVSAVSTAVIAIAAGAAMGGFMKIGTGKGGIVTVGLPPERNVTGAATGGIVTVGATMGGVVKVGTVM
jgi:hypothetical protein